VRVAVQREHAGSTHVGDSGARLGVGRLVGQLVIVAERLLAVPGAHPAGDVESPADEVLPDAVNRPYVGVVAGEGGDVGHAAVLVHGPDGMPDRVVLLGDRLVVL
jgi:hypothetical protein